MRLQTKATGWLVWGKEVDFYAVPSLHEPAFVWEAESAPAIEVIRSVIMQSSWWEDFIKHLAQEHARDYLAYGHSRTTIRQHLLTLVANVQAR